MTIWNWPPGGGSGGNNPAANVWDGRVVPSGLAPQSDEFLTDTIASGKWSLWNHGANLVASVDTVERCMILQMTGDTTVKWGGVYQPIPSNAFGFAAEFDYDSEMGTGAQNPFAALAIMTDATQAAGAGATFGTMDWERNSDAGGSNWPLRLRDGVAYNGGSGFDTRIMEQQPTTLWMRARIAINANVDWTIRGDWSTNGVAWNEWRSNAGPNFRTRATAGLTAKHFGLAFLQLPASTCRVKIKHFRVWDGVNTFNAMPRNGGYLG